MRSSSREHNAGKGPKRKKVRRSIENHHSLSILEKRGMGWCHPDVSLDDLIDLIKGFVDILILASGYQSSGLRATWDVVNIKKAINWGLFFEDLLKRIEGTDEYQDSVKELDAALANLISNSLYPQGLAQMSSASLSNARHLVLEHLLEFHPLKDAHLISLLTAVIEMDINNLREADVDGSNAYIDRLMLQIESLNLVSSKDMIKDSTFPSSTIGLMDCRPCNPNMPVKSCGASSVHDFVDHSHLVIQEILKRRSSITCLSSTETCIDNLSKIVTRSNLCDFENNHLDEIPCINISPMKEEMMSELSSWNQWRSKCLSYFRDKRTIRLLSGADLIFSAPTLQWIRVFEPLKFPIDGHVDNLIEIIEILLLGFISSRWSFLIEHFISQSCDFVPMAKQISDLHHLLLGYSPSKIEALNSKEKDIIEYLMQLLRTQPHKLWHVPPVLVAAALSPGSVLFKMYFSDIEKQFNEASSSIRCCNCSRDGKEHRNCDVAERIRCLFVFHIQGSNLMVDC